MQTMVDYSIIKNDHLRALVMISESIGSLEETAISRMVERIARLPEQGQTDMITALEDERRQIEAATTAHKAPEKALEEVSAQEKKLILVNRSFDRVVREENEKTEQSESSAHADDLLHSLT